ncbi:unnamed protein product [Caenorhabditis brenneri]
MDDMKHQIIAFLEQMCNDFRLSPMSDKELAERFNLFNYTKRFEREGNGYSNRNFTCPINRLPWNIYETTKLFNFIQSRTRGTPFHVRLEDLMKTFKEKEARRRTVEQLVAKATRDFQHRRHH